MFIFDFGDLKDDWDNFTKGKYSKVSKKTKNTILGFFENGSPNHIYMKSYLHPEKYFEDYAECLGVEIDFLKSVGELCAKPDIEKETLIMKQEDLQKNQIIN